MRCAKAKVQNDHWISELQELYGGKSAESLSYGSYRCMRVRRLFLPGLYSFALGQIKIQQLFADALAPMLTRLKTMQEDRFHS